MKPIISYEEFNKLDLRVGKVIEAYVPEWSKSAMEFKVNFGPEIGQKTILAGIKEDFKPQALIGKSYIFLANLAEKQMGKSLSQGMMLMAVDENNKPTLIKVDKKVKSGTIVR